MLCQSLLYTKMTLIYTHIYILFCILSHYGLSQVKKRVQTKGPGSAICCMILEKLNSLIFNFFFNKLWLRIPFKQGCGQGSESAYQMALEVKNLPVNAGNIRDAGSIWVRKILWRRAWHPTPVFLPGESPWTEEPGKLQSMGSKSQTRLK